MSDNSTAAAVAMTVRLDRELRRQIEDAAKSSLRPLSREIVYRLKRSFERQRPEAVAS
jgi:hypothetical protein